MLSSSAQAFLKKAIQLAGKRCGYEFLREFNSLRYERELLLNYTWKIPECDEITSADVSDTFREIDFDTLIVQTAKHLDESDYANMLYELAELADQFGELKKALFLLRKIIDRYRDCVHPSRLAHAYKLRADIALRQNDFSHCKADYETCLEIFKQIKDTVGIASTMNGLGVLMVEQNDPEAGKHHLQEAHNLAAEIGAQDLSIDTSYNLGNTCHILGDYPAATEWYENALSLLGENNAVDARAAIFHNMGIVLKSQQKLSEAGEFFTQSFTMAEKSENLYMKGLSYLSQAELACMLGDYSKATAQALSSFTIFTQLHDRLSIADVYKVLGMIHREIKRVDVAISYFENSLRINEECDGTLNYGETAFELAQTYVKTGELSKAEIQLNDARSSFEQLNAKAKLQMVENYMTQLSI